jgi:hypothetical protein
MATTDEQVKKVEKSMHAFKNLEGMDYYPQIFIPFYGELKSRKNSKQAKSEVVTSPTLIIYTGDEQQEVYKGYKVNEMDELEEIPTPVDEEYARNNETWVLSLNEKRAPCEPDDLDCAGGGGGTGGTGGGGTGGGTTAVPSAIIDGLRIKCHKESWVAGASEVHILAYFTDQDGKWAYRENYEGGSLKGGRIKKIDRRDVRYEKWFNTNFYIAKDWDNNGSITNKVLANYVIFEHDSWPSSLRMAQFTHGSYEFGIQYRSADSYYDKAIVSKNSFAGRNVDNGCIEWRGQYQ